MNSDRFFARYFLKIDFNIILSSYFEAFRLTFSYVYNIEHACYMLCLFYPLDCTNKITQILGIGISNLNPKFRKTHTQKYA